MKKITLMLIAMFFITITSAQVQIGEGTLQAENAPFEPFFEYSYTQTVYTSSEINASGSITGLQWYYSGTTALPNSQGLTIYMAESSRSEFTSTTDWEPIASFTQVYSGGITVTAGTAGWVEITFDTPFNYSGTNNLIIAVDENMADYDSSNDDFHNSQVTTDRSISYFSDTVNPDPAAPPTASNIDDTIANVILLGIQQACPSPSALTATNITDTSADLGWTIGGTETEWEYVVQAQGTGEPSGDGIDTTTNPVNASSLMPNTTYEFYVRANCGSEFSSWVGPFSFTTECAPLTPNYNADMSVNVPDCWEEADNGDASSGPMDLGSGSWTASNHNGTPSNRFNLYLANRSDWIISPEIDLSTSAPSELKVYVALTENGTSGSGADLGSDDRVSLLMTTDGGSSWSSLQTWSQGNVPTDVGEEITYDLTAQTGTVQFAFLAQEGTVDDTEDIYFHVSKFEVREIPSCEVPSALTASMITTTSAQLAWTAGDSETLWNIELGTAGFTPTGSPTASGVANPYAATGLTSATDYEYYVQADCEANGTSLWVGPFAFSTLCDAFAIPFTEGFNSDSTTESCWTVLNANSDADEWNLDYTFNTFEGDQVAAIYTDFNGGANDDWLISPGITLTGNERLKYQYRVQSSGEPNDFEVVLSTSGTAPADFTNTLVANAVYNNTNYVEQVVNLSAYTGTVYIAWHIPNGGPDGWRVYIDDVIVETLPSCVEPSALTASMITVDSAELSWTAGGSETLWNIELGAAGFTPTGTATASGVSNPYDATGLSSETAYEYYVQADCEANGTSVWVGPFAFSTPPGCGDTFYDTGGSTGAYENNADYTITICPDTSGDAVSVQFNSFLVEGDGADDCWDFLYIYDGDSNTATAITPASLGIGTATTGFCWQAAGDGTADLTGQTITSSDTTGCLTFNFTSDGSGTFAGWDATIGCAPLSLQDVGLSELFTYYPNPVNNTLNITAKSEIDSISVYNLLGQEVIRTSPRALHNALDMSTLNSGAYFVKVAIGNSTETVRIIKN